MKLVFLWALMFCYVCRAQTQSSDNDILPQVPGVESEEELVLQSEIWAELRKLRDMVVEHSVELRHLTARLTAAETLVEALQQENTGQATELSVIQQELVTLQQTLTSSELRVEELQKQQEEQKAAVQDLQIASRVRKIAFSTSLLDSGEGNTLNEEFTQLIYRKVFTNIGNQYNQNTGYFTAPIRGVYFFRYTGHIAHTERGTRMALIKNGQHVITAGDRPTTTTDAEDNVSNGVVLELKMGDVVSVHSVGDIWDDQYHRTTFSGFLVFPL